MKSNTQNAIIEAFNQLIQRYSFEEITTRMILSQAGISKATFYRYFKDKHDVMCSNYDRILAKSIDASHNIAELMYHLALEYSLLGKQVGKAFLRYSGANNYSEYVNQRSAEFLFDLYRNKYGKEMSADELFQCRIVLTGISNNIHILSVEATLEEMRHKAELLVQMMPKAVACLTWQ